MLQMFLVLSIKTQLKILIMKIPVENCEQDCLGRRMLRWWCNKFFVYRRKNFAKEESGPRKPLASIRYFGFLLFVGWASSGSSGCASSLNSTSRERELTVLSALFVVSSLSVPRRM